MKRFAIRSPLLLINGVQRHPHEKEILPVMIGMTTIPERLMKGKTQQAIQSILNNHVHPQKIILTIPTKTLRGETYPQKIFEQPLFQNPLIKLHFVDEDEGPILKLNGLLDFLKKGKIPLNKSFVLMDDDIIYPPDILQNLWDHHKNIPHASIGYAGRIWLKKRNRLIFFNLTWQLQKLLRVHIIETFHLALHPLDVFFNRHQEWLSFVKEVKEECKESVFTDDIVISLWCKMNRIPRLITKGPTVKNIDHGTAKLSDMNLCGRNDFVFARIWKNP